MPEAEIVTQEVELKTQALTVVERARMVKIVDEASYLDACSLLKDQIKPFREKWVSYWRGSDKKSGPLSLAYRAYDSLMEKFNQVDKPLEAAEKQIRAAALRWEAEQARLREERQRQAQLEAERKAAEDREKEALFAELAGIPEQEVQAIAEMPVAVVAAPVEPTYTRVAGVTRRPPWKARVTNLKALCAAIGKGQVPVTYVLPNERALNDRANADKSTLNIPGVQAYDPALTGGQ